MDSSYAYVWEFLVQPGMEAEFEQHYSRTGTWARLFRQSPDYIETLLLGDNAVPGRYLTIDRWRTEASHHAFRAAFSQQYEQLDQAFEHLTVSERSLGCFNESLGAAERPGADP
jgi:heme-degrading monooxygenase HmoA